MIEEVSIKTHLIVTGVHEEYEIKWCGKFKDVNPKLQDGLPIFVIVGDHRRVEMNTCDMKRIEECAKKLTNPRGRESVTTDSSEIYIKEKNGNEKLVGVVIHHHIKQYSQMRDKVNMQV